MSDKVAKKEDTVKWYQKPIVKVAGISIVGFGLLYIGYKLLFKSNVSDETIDPAEVFPTQTEMIDNINWRFGGTEYEHICDTNTNLEDVKIVYKAAQLYGAKPRVPFTPSQLTVIKKLIAAKNVAPAVAENLLTEVDLYGSRTQQIQEDIHFINWVFGESTTEKRYEHIVTPETSNSDIKIIRLAAENHKWKNTISPDQRILLDRVRAATDAYIKSHPKWGFSGFYNL